MSLRARPWSKLRLALVAMMFSATACTTHPVRSPETNRIATLQTENLHVGRKHATPVREAGQVIREVEEDILEADAQILKAKATFTESEKPRKSTHAKIPLEINQNVLKWIRYFTEKDRNRFHTFLKRGNEYRELVTEILEENGVPTEFYYLAMIESGYVTHAHSHAKAMGVWQFIPGTGERYGLAKDDHVDERRDIIRSTRAAARYLRDLHTVFQSWYLAMASYNAGERRVLGAIMRSGTRDFWELVEKKALPSETRNYVPKFLAATIIGKNPKKYGFHDIEATPFPKAEPAAVPGGLRLADIAKTTGVSLASLKKLNPHLHREMTPPKMSSYTMWVPQGSAERVQLSRARLALLKVQPVKRSNPAPSRYHLVRRGDSLGKIAKKYGTTTANIKRWNNMRSNTVIVGRKLAVAATAASKAKSKANIVYRVKSGDVLIQIARRFEVPVRHIKRANDLNSTRIYVGQRLVIPKGI